MKKRIIYAGTPDFAVAPLRALLNNPAHGKDYEVVAVYTQPDRPAGRGRALQASPVKQCALDAGVEVLQPLNFSDDSDFQTFADLKPDLMVVTAYGVLLPQRVLDVPTHGCVNLHASILPRWRGAAPIQRAIEAGDGETGITLMQMDAGLDTGAMLAKAPTPINDDETGQSLHDKLSDIGAKLLMDNVNQLLSGQIRGETQDDAQANYAKKLSKAQAELDWSQSAEQLARMVRAMNAWPVCFTRSDAPKLSTLRVWMAHPIASSSQANIGTVIACTKDGVDVQTGDGVLRITKLQASGGKPLAVDQFINAHDLTGVVLGWGAS